MEHLDEAIARADLEEGTDFTFTPEAVLTCKAIETYLKMRS